MEYISNRNIPLCGDQQLISHIYTRTIFCKILKGVITQKINIILQLLPSQKIAQEAKIHKAALF
jgi:hypothetical protein